MFVYVYKTNKILISFNDYTLLFLLYRETKYYFIVHLFVQQSLSFCFVIYYQVQPIEEIIVILHIYIPI